MFEKKKEKPMWQTIAQERLAKMKAKKKPDDEMAELAPDDEKGEGEMPAPPPMMGKHPHPAIAITIGAPVGGHPFGARGKHKE